MKPDPAAPRVEGRKVERCDSYHMPHMCPSDHISVQRPDLFCPTHKRLLIDGICSACQPAALDPLEDGRQEFLYRSTGEFVRMMEQCFGGHSLPWSTIERELQNAYDAGWTARAARERELREALEKIAAAKPKRKPEWNEDTGHNLDDAYSNGYDICAWCDAELAEAALSETQPEEKDSLK